MASDSTHIVLSPSAAGLLRQALRIAGRPDTVVGFNDTLAVGPIDPPAPWARARWMTQVLGYAPEEHSWLPRSTQSFWRRVFAPTRRRIVWTSSRSANEQMAFLALVDHIGERPFEVVDMADIEISHLQPDGGSGRKRALSLALLDPPTIAAEQLWRLARPLSSAESAKHQEIGAACGARTRR